MTALSTTGLHEFVFMIEGINVPAPGGFFHIYGRTSFSPFL